MAHNLYNLGNVQRLQGECKKALHTLKRSCRAYERTCGPPSSHPEPVVDTLGDIYSDQCLPNKSLSCWKQALDICTANLRAHNPAVLASIIRVASACCDVRFLDEAQDTYCGVKQYQMMARHEFGVDQDLLKANTSDIGVTQFFINKVRWHKGFQNCGKETIREEVREYYQ